MEVEKNKVILQKIKDSEINNALGIFILFFGIVILIATVFTTTFIGEMTNLVAGLILSAIGGAMVFKSRLTIKKLKADNKD